MPPWFEPAISESLDVLFCLFQTLGSQIDNREIATCILAVILLILAVIVSKGREDLVKSLGGLVKAALNIKLVVPALFCVAYSIVLVALASQMGVWTIDILLDTILEIIFVGIASMAVAVNAKSINSIFKQFVLPEISISAVVTAYITIENFSIPVELALQFAVVFFSMVKVVSERQPDGVSVAKLATWILAFVGIGVFCAMTYQLIGMWDRVDWFSEARSFAMTVCYPFFLLPFVILLGYFSALEMVMFRIKHCGSPVKLLSKLHLFMMLFPSIMAFSHFSTYISCQYADCKNWKEEEQLIASFKSKIKSKIVEARAKQKRMSDGKDIACFDEDGIWRDWSNLKKIKDELWLVLSVQLGAYRDRGQYDADISKILNAFTPINCSNGFYVSKDCQMSAWWMTNKTGFTLGLALINGAATPLRYEGVGEPSVDKVSLLDVFNGKNDDTVNSNWCFDFNIDESYL